MLTLSPTELTFMKLSVFTVQCNGETFFILTAFQLFIAFCSFCPEYYAAVFMWPVSSNTPRYVICFVWALCCFPFTLLDQFSQIFQLIVQSDVSNIKLFVFVLSLRQYVFCMFISSYNIYVQSYYFAPFFAWKCDADTDMQC